MTFEQLQKMHQARPFKPFDIHLADGRTLPVEHPEMLAVPPPGRTIGVGIQHDNARAPAGEPPGSGAAEAPGPSSDDG